MSVDIDIARQFINAIQPERRPTAQVALRTGTVTAFSSSGRSLTLRLGGSTTDITYVPYLASYIPVVDDVVQVLQAGPTILVIGRVAANFRRHWAKAVRSSGAVPAGHGTLTRITYNSFPNDIGGAMNSDGYTAKHSGVHLVVGGVRWAGRASGAERAFVLKNPSAGTEYSTQSALVETLAQSAALLHPMSVGDQIASYVWQSTGSTLDVVAFQEQTAMAVMYMGNSA